MQKPLIGHCLAPINNNEVIIAGGFSPKDDYDYNVNVVTYNLVTQEWYSQPWMDLKTSGPRMDSSCLGINYGPEKLIFMVGGWNNTFMKTTEYYRVDDESWYQLFVGNANLEQPALPHKIRSSGMVDVSGKVYSLGGVKCDR